MPTEREDLAELGRYAFGRLRERLEGRPTRSCAGNRRRGVSAFADWSATLGAVPDAALGEPVGAVAGPQASSTRRAFVLHVLDELVHDGAEAALVRDLWAATRPR